MVHGGGVCGWTDWWEGGRGRVLCGRSAVAVLLVERPQGFHGSTRAHGWGRSPGLPVTHLQPFVLQRLSRGHGRWFLLYSVALTEVWPGLF